jgi:hypothetical protein
MSRTKALSKLVRPIKILAYGDSPVIPSGFGTVMKNIFYYLGKSGRYDIDIFGINDRGNWKDPKIYPYHVYQALPPGETDPTVVPALSTSFAVVVSTSLPIGI